MHESPATPVMIIDDEAHLRITAGQTLELAGYEPRAFERAEDALAALTPDFPGVVISDIRMPGMDGMALLREIRDRDPDLPVVLITGHGDVSTAVAAMRDGAWDFLEKPFAGEHLVEVVRRGIDKRRLSLENRTLKAELEAQQSAPGPRLVGRTPAIQRLASMVQRISQVEADVLLFGETGAGKDLVARAIHERSARGGRPFVAINCGAVPESTIESELFGHEKGAFTGAVERRIGKFEHAQGGTVFLDEIESMPLSLQVKLLRVLQERSIERLGSNQAVPLDIRVIAATKVDLKAAAEAGDFREDLYYRLNVVTLPIPPLRERREDIPLLFQHFAVVAANRSGLEAPPLDAAGTSALLAHDWPGNVRELRNLAERYVLLGITCDYRLETLLEGGESEGGELPLPRQVELFEKSLISQALARHQGRVSEVCDALDVPRKTLYDKLKKHGLRAEDYRQNAEP
ncbi:MULTISPECIES: sigma-54-dependent transcriptional regulator [Halomonas]|uniref:Sigma-54-dependent Fis family transcriptional regulator n=1 Tax=Halomonas halophila TaxID=29573 RepID=A0ABQ0U6H0_9GAMM|nr:MULTISPECIES: sigma-54 dependent transcriptional regulator [Halomonas]MDR5890907.1 sigma-54 dependent transcriptional regulator [Halomonas salina]RAH39423.1 sigma-54-dependent Fis family transcriptional regulator [Halomonas sp. SL1]WJY07563.1 sigma-54 dependent transcriptional regulator [Halomonas halophila]GEK73975.1 sigma-54-dependent Fis family transcriptional regulator [Halomonas halophila]